MKRTEDVPHDRLTGLAAVAIEAIGNHDDYDDDRVVVMLFGGDFGGIGLHGYENDWDAISDVFMHMSAIFEANGKRLVVMPLGRDD